MPGIDECLLQAMVLPGARGAAVIEWTSGLALGTVGESPNGDHEVTAAEMAELARLAAEHTAFGAAGSARECDPGADVPVEDVILTTRAGYHLLRFVETTLDSSVFVYLWLDRDEGNLALARIRLHDLVERLALV